jgi:hypothetical protein
MLRINNRIINEQHIVEINITDYNIEIELSNGKLYDIGMIQQRVNPYVHLEVTQDTFEQLIINLRRY